MTVPLDNESELSVGTSRELQRAYRLAKRIVEQIGSFAAEFQTAGLEISRGGTRMVFHKDDADLLEIAFYAVDGERHIVFHRALRRTYHTAVESYTIYDDDEALIAAIYPTLLHMAATLLSLSAASASSHPPVQPR